MYKQVFPGMAPSAFADTPQARFLGEYDPLGFLTGGGLGRAPTQAELDLAGGAYFGRTAPLNLAQPQAAYGDLQSFLASLSPFASPETAFYPAQISQFFGALGGQIPFPEAPQLPPFVMPTAPTLDPFVLPADPTLPTAPTLDPFSFDVGGYTQEQLASLFASQPGLQEALGRAYDPQIALPAMSIFDLIAQQNPQLADYVERATGGVTEAFQAQLARQQAELESRFAAEGAYMSGPMLSALGQMGADALAQYAGIIGPMQLQAAEMEQGRIYEAATNMYGTEFARNLQQAQIGAQSALQMADVFGEIARTTGSAQADAQARAYATQASFLGNLYDTQVDALMSQYNAQVGALASAYGTQGRVLSDIFGAQAGAAASAYGTQGRFLSDIFGTQAGAAVSQQQMVLNASLRASELMQQGYARSFDEAMQMAMAEQQNQQSALDNLYQLFFGPGQNAMELMRILAGIGNVSKGSSSQPTSIKLF